MKNKALSNNNINIVVVVGTKKQEINENHQKLKKNIEKSLKFR